jgi:hypothetical protein
MAPFAGHLVASDMNLPVYDASASACPENYAENAAGVRGSAINGLRKGEAIGCHSQCVFAAPTHTSSSNEAGHKYAYFL